MGLYRIGINVNARMYTSNAIRSKKGEKTWVGKGLDIDDNKYFQYIHNGRLN